METKHEMRKAAIKRLQGHINHPGYYRSLIEAIVGDDYDELTVEECDKRLIDLLTDDGMDDYAKLPVDADDKTIHVGDEICGYGYPDGGVRCRAIVSERLILAGTDDEPYHEWLMWDAGSCRHYHKPTVEDLLGEFAIACEDAGNAGPAVVALIAEYAPRLRLKEDEDERF